MDANMFVWCPFIYLPTSDEHLETLIGMLQFLAPDSLQIDKSIHDGLQDLKLSAHHTTATSASIHSPGADSNAPTALAGGGEGKEAPHSTVQTFMFVWQMFMILFLVFFAVSLIQHFAQYYQSILDAVSRIYYLNVCGWFHLFSH